MFSKIVSSVSSAFDFNLATLSGCIDIIVVPQDDGTFQSTPFHVRFGKVKLLRSREKLVTITVNWHPTDLKMTLGSAGEAYFIVEDEGGGEPLVLPTIDGEEDLFNIPLSPLESPRCQTDDAAAAEGDLVEAHLAQRELAELDAVSAEAGSAESLGDSVQRDVVQPQVPQPQFVDQPTHAMRPATPPLVPEPSPDEPTVPLTASIELSLCGHLLYGLPSQSQHDNDVFQANLVTWEKLNEEPSFWFHPSLVFRFDYQAPYFPAKTALPLLASWAIFGRPLSKDAFVTLLKGQLRFRDARDPLVNLQLQAQEILNPAELPEPVIAPPSRRRARSVAAPGERNAILRSSGYGKVFDNNEQRKIQWEDNQKYEQTLKGYQGLCARFPCYPTSGSDEVTTRYGQVDESTAGEPVRASTVQDLVSPLSEGEVSPEDSTGTSSTGAQHERKGKIRRFKKSLKPTSAQLQSLNLKPGPNPITFSVNSPLQGTQTVTGTIYLWPRNAKIVVSDVDGTITRSDVWGQLMPIVGKDWSHPGVAELFSNIRMSDYKILYLTARAIGQADSTRDYLFGLTQNEKNKLPDGPLILSPDRLFPSFKREVIDRKPYVFKIAALRDIRNLFPQFYNPFYAAFGNRDTDHRAYVHVGIPEARIFIIDPTGHVHHVNKTYAKTYESMSEIAADMFPALNTSICEIHPVDDQFSDLNYWRRCNYTMESTLLRSP